ncbi:hypothetical protein [Bradyrhizobium uaiense]|uniref:hypothetical protein n=1 Tax=Bradyrhizobium uaiense TaxID=2594946 RepID=UPI001584364F|nr:hypothetical protein [Bradyrhizobium uaiense]
MRLTISALAAALMFTGPALAQQSPMPEDLAWKLLELGRVVDPPKTAALYAPLQQKEPYQGVKVERDVKYGPAERRAGAVSSLGRRSGRCQNIENNPMQSSRRPAFDQAT